MYETSGSDSPYLPGMKKSYINEAHRKYSEACQLEVQEMMRHPLSTEEKEEQIRKNRGLHSLFSPSPVLKSEKTQYLCGTSRVFASF